MTAERRLAKIEASLTPTELIVRWLDEAHAFGGLEAYTDALLQELPERFPLNQLLGDAVAGVERSVPKLRGEALAGARRKALRETAFRFELVMRINVTTHELLAREALIHALLWAQFALHTTEKPTTDAEHVTYHHRLGQCLRPAGQRVVELLATEQACQMVEARYLAGHPALFPDDAAVFAAQLQESERQVVLGLRLAELDGLPTAEPDLPDAIERRAAELVEDLVEPARTTALEKLDENRQALTVATAWLRRRRSATAP